MIKWLECLDAVSGVENIGIRSFRGRGLGGDGGRISFFDSVISFFWIFGGFLVFRGFCCFYFRSDFFSSRGFGLWAGFYDFEIE